MFTTGIIAFLTVFTLATILWGVSIAIEDASIADPFWGVGFVVIVAVCYFRSSAASLHSNLVLLLTVIWGLRLGVYLTWRKLRHGAEANSDGSAEDRRYTAMRNHHGQRFWWVSFFTVFLFQAFLMVVVSLPVQVAIHHGGVRGNGELRWIDFAGVVLWCVGMFFETVGDFQLARFKANPDNVGRVLDTGLWRYTRHPNYFGDFCVWWGLFLIAVSPALWWTAIGPLTISFLLLKVSGVTMLEKTITQRRPKYAEYIRQTNAFFPGTPRSG